MGRNLIDSPDGPHTPMKSAGELFATFGDFLRYLRRRERLTQTELGIAVGYSTQHVHLLESGQRLPDPTTVAALFVPALHLESHPDQATHLVELAVAARARAQAASGRRGRGTKSIEVQHEVIRIKITEEVGRLEDPPTAPPLLVARSLALARLHERLATERRLALCGLPGMGKTTLAAAHAREHALHAPVFWLTFSEGVNTSVDALVRQLALFVLANSIVAPEQVLQLIARSPDSQPTPPNTQILLLSSALARPAAASALFCFDNAQLVFAAHPPNDPVMDLLLRLMATSPAAFLFISREDLPVPGLAHIRLDGLDRDEAGEFMRRLIGKSGAPDQPIFDRLYERTAGSPMLLRLSLGQLLDSQQSPTHFVEQLATQTQIDSYLLGTMIAGLSPTARSLAALVSIFRAPINLYDHHLVDFIHERDVVESGGLSASLAELQRLHILDNPGYATLHPLLRDFMSATLAADSEGWRKMHLLAANYSEQGLGDIVEAAYHYGRADKLEEMANTLADQGISLFNQGNGQSALEVLDDGLAQVRRKRKVPDGLLRRLLTVRGDVLATGLRAGEAETNYREALAVALREGVAPPVRAQIMARLAACLTQRSQLPEALQLCREGLDMIGQGDTLLAAQLTVVQSGVLASLGRFDEAEASSHRAIEMSDGFMSTLPSIVLGLRARTYNVLGMVNAIRQRHDDALRYWSNATEAARQIEYVQLEYRCRGNMGNVYYEMGDLNRATDYCSEAVTLLRSIGDEFGAARYMHTLGNAQYLRRDLDGVLKTMAEAVSLKRSMGDRQGVAISLAMQGMSLLAQGHVAQAKGRVEDALRELDGLDASRTLSYVLVMLCDVQIASGDFVGALETLEKVEHLSGAEADVKLRGDLQNHRALALLAAGDLTAALSVAFQHSIADAGIEISMMHSLIGGALAHLSGDPAAATAMLEQVAHQANEAGYTLYEATASRLIASQAAPHTPAQIARAFYMA